MNVGNALMGIEMKRSERMTDQRRLTREMELVRESVDTYPPWAAARVTNKQVRDLFDLIDALLVSRPEAIAAAPWSDDNLRLALEQKCIWDEVTQKWVSPNSKTLENLFVYVRNLASNPHVPAREAIAADELVEKCAQTVKDFMDSLGSSDDAILGEQAFHQIIALKGRYLLAEREKEVPK